VPRSRNTSIRPKNTSRAEARRRFREEQRELDDAETALPEDAEPAEPPKSSSMFAMPNVLDDIKALPTVFRKPLVWLPFGLLALTLGLSLALINGALDGLPDAAVNGISLYINLTLHPTSLFIFFIGGFVAPRASYLVGGILGLLSATVWTVVMTTATEAMREQYADTLLTANAEGQVATLTSEAIIQTYLMGLFIGILAGGFASWYRRFLRSSQERAAANRAQREREQAEKAKIQARSDREALRAQKYADREARRKSS
jgi:signal transduction histidine kinase